MKTLTQHIINESSLSRIWQHIDGDGTFSVISAHRGKPEERAALNDQYHEDLKEIIRNMNLGYIETDGGYVEGTMTIVKQK